MKKHTLLSVSISVFVSSIISVVVCSVIVLSAGIVFDNVYWKIFVQFISLMIFCSFIYGPSWYQGDRDANAIQFNRITKDSWRGAKFGLIACIPFLLTSIILVLSKFEILPDFLPAIYKLANQHVLFLINMVMPSGYAKDASWSAIFIVSLYPFIIPITTHIGYLLGLKHFSIMDKITYKNKKK